MTSSRYLLALSIALLALAGCSDVRESLGLGRTSPDEFAVIDRAPLSMPPDYGLRPPAPGMPRPQEVNVTERANETLFGSSAKSMSDSDASASEKALLDAAGANKADPNIRTVVDRESANKVVGSEHLVDDLLWWKKDQPEGTAVDATAEAARIKEAKAKDEPLNKGATPVIEQQKSGWLDF